MTNHRVYQELVYQNEVLKTMLTALQAPILHLSPAPTWFLRDFSPIRHITKELQPYISYIYKICMYALEHFGKNLYVIFLFNSNPD